MSIREKVILCGLFVALMIVSLRHNVPEIATWNYHFGGEYGNIAASIARGQGYANPFDSNGQPVETGPTSWMPPLP